MSEASPLFILLSLKQGPVVRSWHKPDCQIRLRSIYDYSKSGLSQCTFAGKTPVQLKTQPTIASLDVVAQDNRFDCKLVVPHFCLHEPMLPQ